MRCICCIWALCLVAVHSGCRTPSASLTNPFLAPDRVPPPATRTLIPGTARPYYPGDPTPNSPAVVSPGTLPTYAPPGTPVVPPGNWNKAPQPYPGTSMQNDRPTAGVRHASIEGPLGPIVSAGEEAIRIQTDQRDLRFAESSPNVLTATGQLGNHSPVSSSTPNLGQPPRQSGFSSPVTPTANYTAELVNYQVPISDPRPVRLRALPAGQLPTNGGTVSPVTRDGFRPQGSSRNRSVSRPVSPSNSSSGSGTRNEVASRFGFDSNYKWLRGRLEHAESADQWQLRYIPIQESPDQFGGRVLIANPQVLSGLRPDDHVQLRGQLHPRGDSSRSFAPIYTVSVVQRQQI